MESDNHKQVRKGRSLPRLMGWLAVVFMSLPTLALGKTDADVLLLLSSNAPYYQETADALIASLNTQPASAIQTTRSILFKGEQPLTIDQNNYRLVVAIGSAASQAALNQKTNTPLLTIFIPKGAFDTMTGRAATSSRKVSAIYLDQPLNRLLALGRLLKPDAKRFGTALGPISKDYLGEIQQLADHYGVSLEHTVLSRDDNPVSELKPVVSNSDIFIAIPDQAILNRAVAKWILYLSFQKKTPVIGFSKAYTNAGALASVYSSPNDIGRHAGEMVSQWLEQNDSAIWQPQYPRYCTLSTNPTVARSLGIKLPRESRLYQMYGKLVGKNHE